MTNIYWPVYRNLEKGVEELSFSIHIDDTQLGVYSSRITDLILRAAAEIESLSKALYKATGGTKSGDFKFDDVAIKHLNDLWLLDQKKVVLSSPHCFQSCRILTPFVKNETRTASAKQRQTFSWNNAYQNLKHDRGNSMRFGSVKYLFDIMAALFVLNVYYKNDVISLDKDSRGVRFPASIGSSIFSVEYVSLVFDDTKGKDGKPAGFDCAIYLIDYTPTSGKVFLDSLNNFIATEKKLTFEHPKMSKYLANNDVSNYQGNLAVDVLGKDEVMRLAREALRVAPLKNDQLRYQAVLNTNPH